MRRLALVLLLLLPSAARAGGGDVALAPAGGLVWATAAPWVVAVDAASGRVVRRVRVANPYPIELAGAGGAVWAGGVENGFVAGAVTRIGPRGTSVAVRLPHGPVLDLAAGAGAVWALAGPWPRARLLRIDLAGGRTRTVPLPRSRALAGDGATAVAVDAGARLYRLTRGRPVAVGTVPHGSQPLFADRDGVWIAAPGGLRWVDLRDGRGRTILHGNALDVAFGGGEAYALLVRRGAVEAVRFDQDGGRILARRRLPPYAVHVAVGAGSVWVAESGARPTLLRLDPGTLAIRRTIALR